MKICSTICEYNPLHNGHVKHLNHISTNLQPDVTAVFLSGNFVQRGEGAILDKYTRAVHAIKAGADIVIELPTVFATSNAELFAKGALKLINSLCGEKSICFGAESDDKQALFEMAYSMLEETSAFKQQLKTQLKSGKSYVSARKTALLMSNSTINANTIDTPNNILAVEYIKAILQNNYPIEVEVLKRQGSGYNDTFLNGNLSSARAIRCELDSGNRENIKNCVPDYVYENLPLNRVNFENQIMFSLLSKSESDLKKLPDCSEGLENKIKTLLKDNYTYFELLKNLKSKRYTEARLRRILLCSMLNIEKSFVLECLNSDLYLKVLAVNGKKIEVLSALSKSNYPLITQKKDAQSLTGTAQKCFLKDVYANDLYNLVSNKKTNEYDMKIV